MKEIGAVISGKTEMKETGGETEGHRETVIQRERETAKGIWTESGSEGERKEGKNQT